MNSKRIRKLPQRFQDYDIGSDGDHVDKKKTLSKQTERSNLSHDRKQAITAENSTSRKSARSAVIYSKHLVILAHYAIVNYISFISFTEATLLKMNNKTLLLKILLQESRQGQCFIYSKHLVILAHYAIVNYISFISFYTSRDL